METNSYYSVSPEPNLDASTEKGSLSSSHVYLLVESSRRRFKIGKADDVMARAAALPQKFSDSVYFQCSVDSVFELEKILHLTFKKFKAPMSSGDGRTEWFDYACFEECKAFVIANQKTFGVESINHINQAEFFKIPADELVVDRAEARLEARRKEQKLRDQNNYQSLNLLKQNIELLKESIVWIDTDNYTIYFQTKTKVEFEKLSDLMGIGFTGQSWGVRIITSSGGLIDEDKGMFNGHIGYASYWSEQSDCVPYVEAAELFYGLINDKNLQGSAINFDK